MCMMSFFFVPLLEILFLQRRISGNVSYLITMKTLKVEVVPFEETFSCLMELPGRLILPLSLIEFGLTSSSLGMSG